MADGRRKAKTQKVDQINGDEWGHEAYCPVCGRSQQASGRADSMVTSGASGSWLRDVNAAGVVYGHVGDVHHHYYCQGYLQHRLEDSNDHPSHNLALPYPQQRKEQTTESKGNRTQANETQVSESARMRPVSGDDVADTVSITDSKGQKLLPGDGVWLSSDFGVRLCIYIGSQNVVACVEGSLIVKKMELKLTDSFQKMSVTRGRCPVYLRRKRVDRATNKIGLRYTQGDWWGRDFPHWVFTGLRWSEAIGKGFRLDL